jgi:hypothetical protein
MRLAAAGQKITLAENLIKTSVAATNKLNITKIYN